VILEGSYGALPETLQKMLASMYASQNAGVSQVETFLQAQRVESGTVQYAHAPFNIADVVSDLFAQNKAAAEARGLVFTLSVTPADYTLSGDKDYLTQVFANLIDNALRYTRAGSVAVALTRTDESIVYSVADTGAGIPETDRAHMFTKYGHGAESRKINPASTGLGLYIVKGIVDGHGGTIWYESVVGRGTTFFVKLPTQNIQK
jgi:signal transduction histidine kinase